MDIKYKILELVFYFRVITRISWNSILTRGTIVKTSGRNVWSTMGSSGAQTYLRVSETSPGSSAEAPPSGELRDQRGLQADINLPSPLGTAGGLRNKCRNTWGKISSSASPFRGEKMSSPVILVSHCGSSVFQACSLYKWQHHQHWLRLCSADFARSWRWSR